MTEQERPVKWSVNGNQGNTLRGKEKEIKKYKRGGDKKKKDGELGESNE